jgi:hypothetical protein
MVGAVGVLYEISSVVLTTVRGIMGVVPPITWSVFVQYMKSEVQNTNSVMTRIVFMIKKFM